MVADPFTDAERTPDMAHEIETHGTQAAAVFARKDAWHRLGITVRDPLSRDSGWSTGGF